ncbi:MAG: hypothetical protein EOP00_13700 [Pedobacter sp.]|nr:MAG: hypothetical protein EOP00_13700 [Pedobacter sp.]
MKTKLNLIIFLIFVVSLKSNAQELFNNEKYGFSVDGPKGWLIINYEDIKKPISHSHGRQNLITYYKNPNNIDGVVNPTIHIYVVPNNFKDINAFNKKMQRRRYEKHLANYSLKDKPQLLTIGGKHGAFEVSTYSTFQKNEDLNVKRRSYVFPTKKFLYCVSLVDEIESEENTAIFKALVESIKIEK